MYFKRIFLSLFFISLLIAGQASAYTPAQINEQKTQTRKADTRIAILESYLDKYNSPLKPEAKNFIEAADKYNIDWKLVAAISGVESTFGKFTPAPSSYNAWGWGVYGNQALYFKSWKDGIYTVSEGLRLHYYNQGLINPYDINRIYAASPAWGAHVSYFLADISEFEKDYQDTLDKTSMPDMKTQISGISAVVKPQII